jgi:hypothetical protein
MRGLATTSTDGWLTSTGTLVPPVAIELGASPTAPVVAKLQNRSVAIVAAGTVFRGDDRRHGAAGLPGDARRHRGGRHSSRSPISSTTAVRDIIRPHREILRVCHSGVRM